jgi:hypothetical protein
MASGIRTEAVDYEFRPSEEVYRVKLSASREVKVEGPFRIAVAELRVTNDLVLRRYALTACPSEPCGRYFLCHAVEDDLFRTEEAAVAEAFLRNERRDHVRT